MRLMYNYFGSCCFLTCNGEDLWSICQISMITCNTDYWMVGEKWTLLTVFVFEQLNVFNFHYIMHQRENFEINEVFFEGFPFLPISRNRVFSKTRNPCINGSSLCNFLILITYRKVQSAIGQLISKGLFAILKFFQKLNETIRS